MSGRNIGSAILIIGSIYFIYTYGFNWWLIVIAVIGLATLDYPSGSDEAKELMKAKAEYYRMKTRKLIRIHDRIEREK